MSYSQLMLGIVFKVPLLFITQINGVAVTYEIEILLSVVNQSFMEIFSGNKMYSARGFLFTLSLLYPILNLVSFQLIDCMTEIYKHCQLNRKNTNFLIKLLCIVLTSNLIEKQTAILSKQWCQS